MSRTSFRTWLALPLILFANICFGSQPAVDINVQLLAPVSGSRINIGSTPVCAQVHTTPDKPIFLTAVILSPDGTAERLSLSATNQAEEDVVFSTMATFKTPGSYRIQVKAWSAGTETWSALVPFTVTAQNPSAVTNHPDAGQRWLLEVVIGLQVVVLAGILLLFRRRSQTTPVNDEAVLKEIRRARTMMEALQESISADQQALSGAVGMLSDEVQLIKQKDRELTDLRLAQESIRRETDAWQTLAMEYLDTLQRGIEQYGDDPRGRALARDAEIFTRYCTGRGLERITAQPGDPLVAELYQVIGEQETTEAPGDTILQCVEWGYRSGDTVYKRAKVILAAAPVKAPFV